MDEKFTTRTYQIIPGLRAYDLFCIFPVSLKMRHFHVTTTGISRVFRHDADVKERVLRACRTVGSSPQSYLRGLLRAMAHTRCCRRFRWVRKLRFERDVGFGAS